MVNLYTIKNNTNNFFADNLSVKLKFLSSSNYNITLWIATKQEFVFNWLTVSKVENKIKNKKKTLNLWRFYDFESILVHAGFLPK